MDAPQETMLSIGLCRVCQAGPLGLRTCGGCGEVVVLCDECDAVWAGGKLEEPPEPLREGDLPCPACGASLIDRPSHWAAREEAAACGWLTGYCEQHDVQLEETVALSPRRNSDDAD